MKRNPTRAQVEKKVKAKAKAYASESDMAKETSKADVAEAAAVTFFVARELALEKLMGTGNAEEMRVIPAANGAYLRYMKILGVTAERVEKDEEEL